MYWYGLNTEPVTLALPNGSYVYWFERLPEPSVSATVLPRASPRKFDVPAASVRLKTSSVPPLRRFAVFVPPITPCATFAPS